MYGVRSSAGAKENIEWSEEISTVVCCIRRTTTTKEHWRGKRGLGKMHPKVGTSGLVLLHDLMRQKPRKLRCGISYERSCLRGLKFDWY